MPRSQSFDAIQTASQTYLDAALAGAGKSELKTMMARVDAAVLRQYALPCELEQSVLSLFIGWKRVGVPFEQIRFFPEPLQQPPSFADFIDYEQDWPTTNRRRGHLIRRNIAGKLRGEERSELERLQAYADYHLERAAPRPPEVYEELESATGEILI